MSAYNFQATIASRGCHVYKETTWSNAKVNEKVKIEIETNQSSITIDLYACTIKAKEKYFDGWKIVADVAREISRYIYFFIKKENGKITGNVKSLIYKPSPIPSGGLQIPLQLTFSCPVEWVRDNMKDFIDDFYSYDFTGIIHNDESSDDCDIEIDLESVDVVEDDGDEEADKMKPVSPVVDKEITNTLIQQEAACIVIDDDQISFVLNSNKNKKLKKRCFLLCLKRWLKSFIGEK